MAMRHAVKAVLMGGSLALVSACGSSPSEAANAAGQVTATAVVTQAPVTVTATPTPTPPAPAASAASAASAAPTTFKMPKLVGVNLQLAQDILQKQGSFVMDQQDALGLDRIQVNDSNWQVCSQTPKAGAVIETAEVITLASVKLSEECP